MARFVRYAVTGVLLAVFTALSAAFADAVANARAKLGEYRVAIKAVQSSGDEKEMQQRQAAAQEILREARKLFDSPEVKNSPDADVLMDYAETLNVMGDFDLAAGVLRRATGIAPGNAGCWLALGKALILWGNHNEEALRALRRCVALDERSANGVVALATLGFFYQREGLYDFSREAFAKALEIDPHHAAARAGNALLDIRDGRLASACQVLEGLTDLSMEMSATLPGRIDHALREFERIRPTFPDNAENHWAYATLLIRAYRTQDCRPPLERAVKLDPKNYVVWNALGSICAGMGDTARAREAFTQSLALNSDQPRTREALEKLSKSL